MITLKKIAETLLALIVAGMIITNLTACNGQIDYSKATILVSPTGEQVWGYFQYADNRVVMTTISKAFSSDWFYRWCIKDVSYAESLQVVSYQYGWKNLTWQDVPPQVKQVIMGTVAEQLTIVGSRLPLFVLATPAINPLEGCEIYSDGNMYCNIGVQ